MHMLIDRSIRDNNKMDYGNEVLTFTVETRACVHRVINHGC